MAKRSVRKARARQAEPAAHAVPAQRARGPWFGALVCAAILVPVAAIAVLAVGGDDQPAASAPAARESDRMLADAERLRRESAARDKEQIQELTDRTRSMVEDFTPVILGLAKTFPPDDERIGPLASAAQVDGWRLRVRRADEFFEQSVSGETATNVARNGFSNAVDVLLETVETYKLALDPSSARAALLERARSQRDLAARAWSTAAVQLDAINIDAGFGHQHVNFPSSAGPGAVPPDTLPEGTDADRSQNP